MCGVPSITRARSSTCWFSVGATLGAALRLMRKLLKKQGFAPKLLVTDKLGSYGSAFRQLRLNCPHDRGLRKNNRAENSHQSCGDESARCSGSSRLDRRSVFSTSIPPSTTPSTI